MRKAVNAIGWLLAIFLLVPITVLVAIVASLDVTIGSGNRAWKILVSYDQLLNVLFGGHVDETFSSRCHRNRHKTKYAKAVKVIDFLFLKVIGQENHCEEAYLSEIKWAKDLVDEFNGVNVDE